MRYQSRPGRKHIEGPKGGRSTCITTLLYCERHGQYSGVVLALTRKPLGPCPQCVADQDWYAKAASAIARDTGARGRHEEVLALAEQMAGHELRWYRAHG